MKAQGSERSASFSPMRRLGPGGGSVRFRPERKGSKNLYAFYPTRSMIESEVEAIWKSQRRWHSDLLTDELLRKIKHIIVDQRPLKPQVPGRCTLFSEDERAPKAHPFFQRFRIFQDVGSLRVREGLSERPLRLDERDHVVLALASCVGAGSGGIVPFERLRANAGLLDGARLNYEGAADRRKGFACDETSLKLRSKKAFDRVWDGLHEGDDAVAIPATAPYMATTKYAAGTTDAGWPPNPGEHSLGRITRDGTTVHIPFLTTWADYNQRIVVSNRGANEADYWITFRPEEGVTATPNDMYATGTLDGNSTIVLRAMDVVTLEGRTRTAATFAAEAKSTHIDVATVIVNMMTGGTDTVNYDTEPTN